MDQTSVIVTAKERKWLASRLPSEGADCLSVRTTRRTRRLHGHNERRRAGRQGVNDNRVARHQQEPKGQPRDREGGPRGDRGHRIRSRWHRAVPANRAVAHHRARDDGHLQYVLRRLSLIHISEPTRRTPISYAVFCLNKKKK